MPAVDAPVPTEADAVRLAVGLLGVFVVRVTRFPTGSGHYVYEVVAEDGRRVVARFATSDGSLNGAVYWSERLRPLGVPLPALLGDDRAARHTPFPGLLLERLSGTDLGHVYLELSHIQKTTIAGQVADVQARVGRLPLGPGYGYAVSYEDHALLPSWGAVIAQSLARSHARITQVGAVSPMLVERVQDLLPGYADYFAAVRPQPFLDDTTTKNVLVDDGRFSGIVDVDYVCFGDPLYTVALTQMALLSRGWELDYTDAWCKRLALTEAQHAALRFYTLIFCVDFLSEVGLVTNGNEPSTVDQGRINHLTTILETLSASL